MCRAVLTPLARREQGEQDGACTEGSVAVLAAAKGAQAAASDAAWATAASHPCTTGLDRRAAFSTRSRSRKYCKNIQERKRTKPGRCSLSLEVLAPVISACPCM